MNTDYDCVVVANGLFPTASEILGFLREAPYIIACDGAAQSLHEGGFRVDAIVGDLDSLSDELKEKYRDHLYQLEEQMTNDLTKAVRFAKGLGFNRLLILGATGKREDHTLGNISLLTDYVGLFDHVEMMSDFGVFIPLKGSTTLTSVPGQQVSVFSLAPQAELSATGLRWEIANRRFDCWWQGTLNEAVGEEFAISISGEAKVVVYKTFEDNE